MFLQLKTIPTSLFSTRTIRTVPSLYCISLKNMDILNPPLTVRGMTELKTFLFDKEIVVPFISLEKAKLSKVMPLVKRCLLKLENLKPIQHVHESEVNILLNPQQIKNWASFTMRERSDLFDVSITENNFMEKTLIIKYENYSADQIFRAILPPDKEGMSSFTKVGHIVHVNLREHLLPYKSIIGAVLFDKVAGCRSVVNKTNMIDNTYRNFAMEVLKGDFDMLTTVKENNCFFKFDFSTVYWNSRLCTEHERIVKILKEGDVMFDIFAGVGPFSVPAAKKKCFVFANDLNPESYKWLSHNFKANKVDETYFKVFNKDGRTFIKQELCEYIPKFLKANKNIYITMNLPAMAVEFLDAFVGLFNPKEVPESFIPLTVFVYCFAKGEHPLEITKKLISESSKGDLAEHILEIFKVRTVSSLKEMMRVTLQLDRDILVGNLRKRKLEDSLDDNCSKIKILNDFVE